MSVSKPMRWPTTRPVLPRASSGTSGFFFCGMMELPVVKRSAIFTKPKFWLIHRISSSLKRLMCTMHNEAAAVNSIAKSRSLTPSRLFWQTWATPCSSTMPSVRATRSRSSG
ncbi:hypothetical protein FQZ97_1082730 [compost metagenome]